MERKVDKKVLLVGLDGATWKVIKPWVDEGYLPALQTLMENGTWGVLETTIPCLSSPAIPAFFTGKNPAKLGFFDFFKHFNDTYGHDVGDEVLKMVARTLSNAMRSFDLAGRWGGEEFVLIVVNMDPTALANTAERIRRLVEHSSLTTDDGSLSVTVSIGAVLSQADDTMDSLLKKADQLMYRSKMDGRNRISI